MERALRLSSPSPGAVLGSHCQLAACALSSTSSPPLSVRAGASVAERVQGESTVQDLLS